MQPSKQFCAWSEERKRFQYATFAVSEMFLAANRRIAVEMSRTEVVFRRQTLIG